MRERTTFKTLLLVLALFLTWGGKTAAQNSYSYEFADSKSVQKSVQTQQIDLGEKNWTLTTEAAGGLGYVGFDSEKGIQLGSSAAPAGVFTLSTTGISGTITKITVNTSGGSSVKGTMHVTVGGAQWGETATLTKTATDYSFTGSAAGEVSLNYDVTAKACYIKSITIEYEGGTPSKPKAQLSFDATTATATLGEAFTAPTLTTTPEGIDVTYSSSNTDVATVDASTGAVTPVKAGTTTITATFAGNDDYTEASASYELTVISNEAVDGLYAAGQRLTETAQTFKVKLTDAVITYVNGPNAYMEDATGGVLIYYTNHGFMPGQKINGVVTVTGELYGGSTKEFTAFDTTEATVTDDATIPVTELTVAELVANVGRYESCRVKISNAAVTEAFSNRNATISQNGTELGLFQKDATATIDLAVNGTYDFVGYPGTYKGAAQLIIWAATDVTPVGKQVAKLTFDATTATATLGEAFTAPTLTTTPEGIAVTYSSSNTDVATVDASTGVVTPVKAGTATITATFAGNDDYTEASASYELTVTDEAVVTDIYDFTPDNYYATSPTVLNTIDGSISSLTFAKGDNKNNEPKWYSNSKEGNTARMYVDNTLTISSSRTISRIEFDINEKGTAQPGTEIFKAVSAGEYVATENAWIGSSKDVVLTIAATTRINKITVYFATSSTTIPITITTDEGYVTLYTDQAYTLPEGLKATSVQYAGNGSSLSMGWEYEAGDVVPAQTALLIQSLDGKAGEYTAEVASDATGAKQPNAGNCLYGTVADETPDDDGQSHYYKLTYSNVDGVKTLGFYWDNETGAPFANKGGKAYLKLPKEETAAVKGFTIGGGAVTGISGVTTDSRQTDAVYTISGVRVQGDPATLPQGIYIVGGKKVLVK